MRLAVASHLRTRLSLARLRDTGTARAIDERLAFKDAVYFFGRMLDVLAFKLDLPLFVSFTEQNTRSGSGRHNSRRIIELQEIEDALREADDLEMTHPPFLGV